MDQKSTEALRRNRDFLLAFLSRARNLEYDRYKLETLMNRFQQDQQTAYSRRLNLQSRISTLQSQQDSLSGRIDKVKPKSRLVDVLVGAIGVFVIILILGLIPATGNILNAIYTPLSLGSTTLGTLELFVITPLLISWLWVSRREKKAAGKERDQLIGQRDPLRQELEEQRKEALWLEQTMEPYYARKHAEAEKELQRLNAQRRQFYACGILHEDYQNVVAAATLFQLLDSRQADVLDGPDGAIRLYEQKVMANRILSSIEAIRRQNAALIDGQQRILERVCSIDENIDGIRADIDRNAERLSRENAGIRDSLDELNRSVDLNNYYAKINTETSQYVAWVNGHVRTPRV